MKLDAKCLATAILKMEEKKPEPNTAYKQVLKIASGNKRCLSKVTLEDITDLMENLRDILSIEFQEDCPHVDLEKMPNIKRIIRRAI